jgi:hypothetical protein
LSSKICMFVDWCFRLKTTALFLTTKSLNLISSLDSVLVKKV